MHLSIVVTEGSRSSKPSTLAHVYQTSLDDFVIALDFDMAGTTDETRPASSRQRQILHSTLEIPVRGYVSAGAPREVWEVDLGTVPVPEFILRAHPNCFALMISGDSLEGDSISDGDIVVVDPDAAYQVDKIYIVLLDDGEVTAKHLTIGDSGQITLRASNDDYQELTVTGRVQGRVVWHMRRM